MATSLEIHLEDSYHAIEPPDRWPIYLTPPCTLAVKELLRRFRQTATRATWYILGDVARKAPDIMKRLVAEGHRLGSHGYWHQRGEQEGDPADVATRNLLPSCVGYRSPFWMHTPRPGMAGGVFFRTLPYRLLTQQILHYQVLYLHPHDFFPSDGLWRRRVFFCDPWKRLDRVLHELEWDATR